MLTQEQIQQFARLDDHYRNNINPHLDNDSPNLRSACGFVRSFAIGLSAQTATDVADALIMPAHTNIAFVNGTIQVIWSGQQIVSTSAVFSDIVEEMAAESLSGRRISRNRFLKWREQFFEVAQYRAEQCFYRFLFACFPQQFCSIVNPVRLRAIMNELDHRGLLQPNWRGGALPQFPDMEPDADWHRALHRNQPAISTTGWYDMCETVVPVLQEAFPLSDYAEHSCFLARIGLHLHNLGLYS